MVNILIMMMMIVLSHVMVWLQPHLMMIYVNVNVMYRYGMVVVRVVLNDVIDLMHDVAVMLLLLKLLQQG